MDAYSPFPIEELPRRSGFHATPLPLIVLLGRHRRRARAASAAGTGSVIAYPLNIGGRPFNSWPAFIPVTFETTILFAAFAGARHARR